jgi:hypothetical protein
VRAIDAGASLRQTARRFRDSVRCCELKYRKHAGRTVGEARRELALGA